MKKRMPILIFALSCVLLLSYAAAAGGTADDPLISLDYLKSIFAPAADAVIEQKLDSSDAAIYEAAEQKWHSALSSLEYSGEGAFTPVWKEARFKQGDRLSAVTGTQFLLLAGEARADFSSGAVVDVTAGAEIASGSALVPRHRYMVAEDTSAVVTTASRTSVVDYCGSYGVAASDATDYNAMAAALKSLTLLRGTDTGFGQGFDLEKAPTRIEALIMLIRLLGEESDALSCTAPQPFSDVPDWAAPYVAYAFERGYSNGIGGGQFGTYRTVVAVEYTEFVLRALGYSSTARSDITDALARALDSGVITDGEQALLEAVVFLRADVVYLSYYALETPAADTDRALHHKLEDRGVFSSGDYAAARKLVASPRIV